jgi:hypothetical protein
LKKQLAIEIAIVAGCFGLGANEVYTVRKTQVVDHTSTEKRKEKKGLKSQSQMTRM